MARILLGWELGAGTGHAVKLSRLAKVLRARGHEIVFALHQIGVVPGEEQVWQAPLWPGQLTTLARPTVVTPATMGDILTIMGLAERSAIAAMLVAWERILKAVEPDVVAAEFAPGLMMAARGRWPLLGLGTGFSLPPVQHARFPSLTGQPSVFSEAALLEQANAALSDAGRPTLDAVPQLFAADLRIAAVFRELDPYREWRIDPYGAPSLGGDIAVEPGGGEEVFLYMNGAKALPNAFWQGIVDAKLPTRVYAPGLNEADCRVLEGAGLTVARRAVPLDEIVARSRLVVSHGGLGFACSMLLAGLPHVFVPFDIEKRMIAASVEGLGAGLRQEFFSIEKDRVRELVQRCYADEAMTRAARGLAPGFRARMARSCEEETAEALEGLAA